MKLLCDEGVERQVVERLREGGHDVSYMAEDEPSAGDDYVLERAAAESAVLVTTDKDFGELVFRQKRASSGVLLLRLAGLANQKKAAIVAGVLRDHGQELQGAFSVVTPNRVRIRRAES